MSGRICALLLAAIGLQLWPPLALWFESSMARHMLLQLPLLAALGALLARAPRLRACLARDRAGAISAAVLSVAAVYWMLPINLDAAIESAPQRAAKVLSLPLAGMALVQARRALAPLAAGLLALELWAMLARAGWLYLASERQLCSYYLPDQQAQVGAALCALALGAALAVSGWLLFGHPLARAGGRRGDQITLT